MKAAKVSGLKIISESDLNELLGLSESELAAEIHSPMGMEDASARVQVRMDSWHPVSIIDVYVHLSVIVIPLFSWCVSARMIQFPKVPCTHLEIGRVSLAEVGVYHWFYVCLFSLKNVFAETIIAINSQRIFKSQSILFCCFTFGACNSDIFLML